MEKEDGSLIRAFAATLSISGGIVTTIVRRRFRHAAWTGAMLAAALGLASHAQAQEQRIAGRVVDAGEHTPIPAATVVVPGTTIGANTTDSGAFTMHVPASAHSFTVRRIGYLAQTVTIEPGKTEYTVALQKDVLRLEAQIVTGVATTVSTQNAANAVAAVNTQEVNEVPAPTVENAIQGQVPGAVIEQNNGGAPGGGMQIQIRGITSIFANASPLYIIDGVFVNNETIPSGMQALTLAAGGVGPNNEDNNANRIADINPDDIESIQILKGASASAIYGSKASSGVIIITTKKGSSGKPQWQISQKVGHFETANSLDLRTFPTLASAEAWATQTGHSVSGAASVYAGPQDFQGTLFGNTQASYETDLSVGGTQGGTQYFLSALSKYDNGTLLNSGYNKQTARANVSQQFNSALSVSLNLMYANSDDRRGVTSNENNGIAPMDVMTTTPQFIDLNHENPDGSWAYNPYGLANPFADAAEVETPELVNRFIGGGNFDWRPYTTDHQSVDLKFIGGADFTTQHDQFYAPPTLQVMQLISSGLPGVATLQNDVTQYLNYSINAIHHWTPSPALDATTSIGFVRERRSDNAPDIVSQNLIAGLNTPTAGTVTSVFYNRDETLDQSLYAQEQVLTLNQRLALTGGVTAERTTNDGFIDRFYAYPHAAASYRIPQFVGFLDELKIRAAYGQSGTEPNYGVKYSQDSVALINGALGQYPGVLHGDPTIRPEQEAETELGFDATFFKSRAQFSFTVYQKQITDLLLEAFVAPSLYYNSEWFNGGGFTNQGIELQLTATPVELRNGFTWNSTTSFYRNYSNVNSSPVPPFAVGYTFEGIVGSEGYFQPGRSVSELVAPGILQANGQPLQVGDFQPSFVMSFGQELTWNRFRLYGLLDWHRGGTVINISNFCFDGSGDWTLANQALSMKRADEFDAGSVYPYLESATFVKLRELTLSYSLPVSAFGWTGGAGLHISSARLSLTGRNLLAWFPYSGLDPEVSVFGNQQVTTAQDVFEYPPSRSFFLGLDLGL
jgi:TonB-dependent starch-binding outer membrane protein SusC